MGGDMMTAPTRRTLRRGSVTLVTGLANVHGNYILKVNGYYRIAFEEASGPKPSWLQKSRGNGMILTWFRLVDADR